MYRIECGNYSDIRKEIGPVYRSWVQEMSQKKFGDGPWALPQKYIVYRYEEEIVSFLLYSNIRTAVKAVAVDGAWTHPDHRRKGLYNNLFERLKKEAADDLRFKIRSGYHEDNTISAEMQRKQGRKIIGFVVGEVITEYKILNS